MVEFKKKILYWIRKSLLYVVQNFAWYFSHASYDIKCIILDIDEPVQGLLEIRNTMCVVLSSLNYKCTSLITKTKEVHYFQRIYLKNIFERIFVLPFCHVYF